MKLTNLSIKDLITPKAKLTFLVGAGCSVDPPSCLPAGRAMMDAIIDYVCIESEIEKIKGLEDLRFEALVEIVRDQLDKNLNIIDFYGECDKPNFQHFFFAELIKKGQFVVTTNFDFLMEYALLESGVPNEDIIPVITKEDFENYFLPDKLYSEGKKTLYKIHGSTKNIITGKDTKESLVATIQAFGSNKEGQNVFQLESFKQPLFENITFNRSLVVIGYSGSDDFDIVPTLKVLKNLRNVIWLNFVKEDMGMEKIYEIDASTRISSNNLDKVDQILFDIQKMNNADHIYRVDVNTTRLIRDLIEMKPYLEDLDIKPKFKLDPIEWINNNVRAPHKFMKILIPYEIYIDFNMYKDALRCTEKVLRDAEETKKPMWKAIGLSNMGYIYNKIGQQNKALNFLQNALQIFEKFNNLTGIALHSMGIIYERMGIIYEQIGQTPLAIKTYHKAYETQEKLGNLDGMTSCLGNLGIIYEKMGQFQKSLEYYKKAYKMKKDLGNLQGIGVGLLNMGNIFKKTGNLEKGLDHYERAYNIFDQLGQYGEMSKALEGMGLIRGEIGQIEKAIGLYKRANDIHEKIGDTSGIANNLAGLGRICINSGQYNDALEYYEKAYEIEKKLGNLWSMAADLNDIGIIYERTDQPQKAINYYHRVYRIDQDLQNLNAMAEDLDSIGKVYSSLSQHYKAFEYYQESYELFKRIENHRRMNHLKENIEDIKKSHTFSNETIIPTPKEELTSSLDDLEILGRTEWKIEEDLIPLYIVLDVKNRTNMMALDIEIILPSIPEGLELKSDADKLKFLKPEETMEIKLKFISKKLNINKRFDIVVSYMDAYGKMQMIQMKHFEI